MIGFVRCQCLIYNASSLKEKRAVLKSVIVRIRQRYNVSVSELDFHDLWQRTEIGIVTISKDKFKAEQELALALKIIDGNPEIERAETTYEWL
ncbi:DUF503 domain-containing protein [Bacillus taeanensis]|uniref:DUF503 domain-containing protein n=1 Tax=Bacillus taeanensis TaxID=273032 RepID=A0A366XW82_9BACI|nr:DUF503 family protein [Bacillus taeanensis]RBW69886.1 DUF503 domain-containing protein [Bacillus taeanensis]